ncbi:MAG: glycosyltransferase family 1 protein [Alphaproteobacteria bacterium]
MRTNVTLYQAFQRLRGRRYTREEILRIRREEFDKTSAAKRTEYLSRTSRGAAELDSASCIISVGLDWQYKDLRSLWDLKQSHGFHYVPMVHDFIPLSFPHFVSPGYDAFLADYFGELIWLADCAMCNSQSTRTDWMRFCDGFGVDVPGHAFALGCDLPAPPAQTELPPVLLGKRFALFVSTIEPRKNHRVLYDAWDRCIRSGAVDKERDRLVFVGRIGWAVDDLMRELAANPATCDSIVVLNDVNDDALATLYRECAFVVFPSFWEGYGIPVAEALGYGKPCISSDAGSLCEIGGDLVMRIDPKDTIRWADAIAHYMGSQNALDDWGRRIQTEYRRVTWDASAQSFFSTIKDAVS